MTHTYESVLQHITGYLHNKLAGAPEVDAQAHFTKDLNINSLQRTSDTILSFSL